MNIFSVPNEIDLSIILENPKDVTRYGRGYKG